MREVFVNSHHVTDVEQEWLLTRAYQQHNRQANLRQRQGIPKRRRDPHTESATSCTSRQKRISRIAVAASNKQCECLG